MPRGPRPRSRCVLGARTDRASEAAEHMIDHTRLVRPSEREPFTIRGAWWRPDGAARAAASEPPAKPVDGMGLEDGMRYQDAPGDPLLGRDAARPCYGTLSSVADGAYRLELPGASDRVFDHEGPRYVVHGITEENVPCSLLDCFTTSSARAMLGGGYRSVEMVGHLFVHGGHLDDIDGFRFAAARIELAGLRDFVGAPLPDATGDASKFEQGPLNVAVPGGHLTFHRLERRTPGPHRLTIEEDAFVRIDLDTALTYAEWEERWTTPLINLVEFATREPSRLHDFVAITHDKDFEMPPMLRGRVSEEALSRREMAFMQPRSALRGLEPRHGYQRMLLSASALGDQLECVIRRWLDLVTALGPATGMLFGTLSSRMYVTSQLIVLASVAEAYHRMIAHDAPVPKKVHEEVTENVLTSLGNPDHRKFYERALRYVNQPSQEQRIVALTKRAGALVEPLGNKPGRLGQRITQTRNALVHLPAEPRGAVLEPDELIEAVELLVLVLHANLLIDLGLADQHAATLLQHSYGRQLLWQRLYRRGCSLPKHESPCSR
jgi:hypothetical protein